MSEKLPSVNDIIVTQCGGAWETKSGGILNVLYKIDYSIVEKLLTYDEAELSVPDQDIRGLRSYRVHSVPKGAIGANEWHKIRNELVFAPEGSFLWTCEDTYGDTREFTLDGNSAVFTPHHILHRYESLKDGSTISVLANTLFDPNDPSTHDSYSLEIFRKIQQEQPL